MPKLYPKSSIPPFPPGGSRFSAILAKTGLSACKHWRKCLKNDSHVDIFGGSPLLKPAETCRGWRKWRFLGNSSVCPTWVFCIHLDPFLAEVGGSVAEVTPPHPLAVTSATALEARSGSVTTCNREAAL